MTSGVMGRHQQISFNDSVPNSPASITPGLVWMMNVCRLFIIYFDWGDKMLTLGDMFVDEHNFVKLDAKMQTC